MKTAMEHINQAFGHLSRIAVSGDNVDRAALARQELRLAYGQLEVMVKESEKKKEENDKNDENDERAEEVKADGNDDRQTAEDAK